MYTLLLAVAVASASASSSTPVDAAQLRGKVTDFHGNPLANVRVTVVEFSRLVLTDQEGNYALSSLPTGSYTVTFALLGFGPQTRRIVLGTEVLTLNVTLNESLVELPPLQVTASPNGSSALTSPQPVSVLSGARLQADHTANLGETIDKISGRLGVDHRCRDRQAGDPRAVVEQRAGPREWPAHRHPAVCRRAQPQHRDVRRRANRGDQGTGERAVRFGRGGWRGEHHSACHPRCDRGEGECRRQGAWCLWDEQHQPRREPAAEWCQRWLRLPGGTGRPERRQHRDAGRYAVQHRLLDRGWKRRSGIQGNMGHGEGVVHASL